MTYLIQFSDGPLDGVKFESPVPFDEIRLSHVAADGSEPTVFYECDWERPGVEWRKRGDESGRVGEATLLNFVLGPDDRAYEVPNRPTPKGTA